MNIGFPDGHVIYITDKYHDDTFCSYETELLPSLKTSLDDSSKKSMKIGIYGIILACSVFVIMVAVTVIVAIIKRKKKDTVDELDNEKLIPK